MYLSRQYSSALVQGKLIFEQWIMSWLMMMLLLFSITTAIDQTPAYSKPGCQDKCGNISVPYPFGIGEPHCAINEHLFLNCTRPDGLHDELWLHDVVPALNISLLEGTMIVNIAPAYDCYNRSGALVKNTTTSISLPDLYTFSNTQNMFIAIGCDTTTFLGNFEPTFAATCVSLCFESTVFSLAADNSICSGAGCCQTKIGPRLKSLYFFSSSLNSHSNVSAFNPCGYAFLADKRSFKASDWQLSDLPDGKASNVVIEWVVETKTCEEAQDNTSSYACGNYTDCIYSNNSQGYRCLCKDGFAGNPYLSSGCQDIDECKDPRGSPCVEGKCKNTVGNYTCKCPLGMHGDGKTGCQGMPISTIGKVIGSAFGSLLFLIVCTFWLYKLVKKRRSIQLRKKHFKRNGGLLLQKHVSSSDGRILHTKLFTSKELAKATDQFNVTRILGQGGQGTVYKGMLAGGEIVAIKRSKMVDEGKLKEFVNEVVLLSQINHRNVVRLLGCCLETEVPLLVYEFVPNGTLSQYIHDQTNEFSLSWEMRLQIAAEIAGALSYLHSSATVPIYHRDVKSTNILLDEKYRAKVADFGTSSSIAIDQTHLTTNVKGTFGYLDPEYFLSSQFTDKSDVYSFGVVLVELLTGLKPIFMRLEENKSLAEHFILSMEKNSLLDILDDQVKKHSPEEEVVAVANLAMKCVNPSGKRRPAMKEVTAELEGIRLSRNKMNIRQDSEEDENIKAELTSMSVASCRSCCCFQDGQALSPEVLPFITYETC